MLHIAKKSVEDWCRRGDLNPHELALTRPSTYEDVSGECCLVLVERAPCGRTFGVVGLRPGGGPLVCYQVCHQRPPLRALTLTDPPIAGSIIEGLSPHTREWTVPPLTTGTRCPPSSGAEAPLPRPRVAGAPTPPHP